MAGAVYKRQDASHAADKLEKLGRPLSRREEAACYQPMKALCACLIVFGIPLVLGVYLAATAEPYTYACLLYTS